MLEALGEAGIGEVANECDGTQLATGDFAK